MWHCSKIICISTSALPHLPVYSWNGNVPPSLGIPRVEAAHAFNSASSNFMFAPPTEWMIKCNGFSTCLEIRGNRTVFRGSSHTSLPAYVWQNNLLSIASRDCLLIFKELLLFQTGTEIFVALCVFYWCLIYGWLYSKRSVSFLATFIKIIACWPSELKYHADICMLMLASGRSYFTLPVSSNLRRLSSCGSPAIGDRGDQPHPSDAGLHVLLQRHHQCQGKRRAQDLLCAHRDDPLSVSRECNAVTSWICTTGTTTDRWLLDLNVSLAAENALVDRFCHSVTSSAAVVSIIM